MRAVPKWVRNPGRIALSSIGPSGSKQQENVVWADKFFMTRKAQDQLRKKNMYAEINNLQEIEKIIDEHRKTQE